MTIPNCSLPHNKGRHLVTFFASIFWIGVLSYFLVTWASKLVRSLVLKCLIPKPMMAETQFSLARGT